MGIRTFISVELPPELKERIAVETRFLREAGALVKWTPPENFHITLKFLGSVPEEKIEEIERLLEEAVMGATPFEVEFAGTGVFPGRRNPRVVWAGINDPEGKLSELQEKVEDALAAAGFGKEEKKYKPHLTLGRVRTSGGRSGTGPEAAPLVRELATLQDRLFGKIMVKNIHIMKSELSPKGSRYTPLREIRLGGRA